jgi:predicted dehydrogenase
LEALEVARVSAETGMLCSTAFKKRYNVAYSRAKEWIAKFDPDDLYSISVDYASLQYSNKSLRESFLHDFAIHIIDLTCFLFGDVHKVFCFAKGPDAYAASLKFANGAVGSMNLNCGRSFTIPTEEVEISIRGGNFMTIHNSSNWRITENNQPLEWREPPTFTSAGDSGNDTGHLAEIVSFFSAIKKKSSTRSNIYESYKSVMLYEAIKESAETEKIVTIHYDTI